MVNVNVNIVNVKTWSLSMYVCSYKLEELKLSRVEDLQNKYSILAQSGKPQNSPPSIHPAVHHLSSSSLSPLPLLFCLDWLGDISVFVFLAWHIYIHFIPLSSTTDPTVHPRHRLATMGKLTSTIGIPIKLLNEAQVHTSYLTTFLYAVTGS